MLTKNIGAMYFQLPLSDNSSSVMYGGIQSAADIDFMTEGFTGASKSWEPFPGNAKTCVTLLASRDRAPSWRMDCTREAPPNFRAGSFLNDLERGLFVQRHTDFLLGRTSPIAFQRMYRPRDEGSRAFGIGTNHSFDIFLVGDSAQFTYIDLVMEDGGRSRFKRKKLRSGTFYSVGTGDFAGADLKWNGNGWNIKRLDGWTYIFPSANVSSTRQQCALLGFHDENGHAVRFVRDSRANLVKVTHFEGDELQFSYDSQDRIVHAEDNNSRSVDYRYDGLGRLVEVTDNTGLKERYAYDSENRMLKVWWEEKLVLSNEYDRWGRLIRQVDADGQVFLYTYDSYNGNMDMAHFTRPDGYVSHLYFQSPGGTTQSLPERVNKVQAEGHPGMTHASPAR
jgi:YD repeat-containing protein